MAAFLFVFAIGLFNAWLCFHAGRAHGRRDAMRTVLRSQRVPEASKVGLLFEIDAKATARAVAYARKAEAAMTNEPSQRASRRCP